MQKLSRLVVTACGLAALMLIVLWLRDRPVVRFTLGPGDALVARPGVETFAVRTAPDIWELYHVASRGPEDALRMPVPLEHPPQLADDGAAWGVTDSGLFEVRCDGPRRGEVIVRASAAELPEGARLVALLAGRLPLLAVPPTGDTDGLHALVLATRARPAAGEAVGAFRLETVAQGEVAPRWLPGAPLVGAPSRLAFALRGESGWEVWSRDHDGEEDATWTRVVAEGCRGDAAIFLPDSSSLIVEGRQGGLWYLHLPLASGDDPYARGGSMELMAQGNLGVSRRVDAGHGFRRGPDLLVMAQWDVDGFLHIVRTNLGGGGSVGGLHVSRVHHYAVTLSPDGQRLAWCQADFAESGDAPFREDLYVFDFDRVNESAIYLGSRDGGGRGRGPSFVGRGGSLVYVADGRVIRIECDPAGGGATLSP